MFGLRPPPERGRNPGAMADVFTLPHHHPPSSQPFPFLKGHPRSRRPGLERVHPLLDVSDGLSRVEVFRARFCAVHNRVTP